jgi:fused signal recognition particle receptor
MWSKIKTGLTKTSQHFKQALSSLGFGSGSLSLDQQESLEELLLMADFGPQVTLDLMRFLKKQKELGDEKAVRLALAHHITSILLPYEKELLPPRALLVLGVNGSGKTTTLGKLAIQWSHEGHAIHLIAADTFRAAAIEQLDLWRSKGGQRHRAIAITMPEPGKESSAATLVVQGFQRAAPEECVLIDTAGRLPNKVGLMDELVKVYTMMTRFVAPERCEVILILDATLGQHALTQVEMFQKKLPLTGLILNKMDGTAKGGILLHLAQKYKIPIVGLGIGENATDFCPFQAQAFAFNIMGLDAPKP